MSDNQWFAVALFAVLCFFVNRAVTNYFAMQAQKEISIAREKASAATARVLEIMAEKIP